MERWLTYALGAHTCIAARAHACLCIFVYETEVGSRGALIRCRVYVCSAATWIGWTEGRTRDRRRVTERQRERERCRGGERWGKRGRERKTRRGLKWAV